MTKTQAQNYVKNTKYIVFNEDESKQLQNKLLEIGCDWRDSGKIVCNTEYPFLYVSDKLMITCDRKACYIGFESDFNEYKQTDHILNIELEQPKPKFDPRTLKPYDKVLVKNEGETWNVDFFDRYFTEKELYLCIGGLYEYCIPYNEETKYLHGNGNKEPEFYQQD